MLEQTEPHYWNMESAWHFALKESESLRPLFDMVGYPSFLQLTFFTWMVFFLQVLYSLAYCIPTSWEIQASSRPSQAVAYDFREAMDLHFKDENGGKLVYAGSKDHAAVAEEVLNNKSYDRPETVETVQVPDEQNQISWRCKHKWLGLCCGPCTTAYAMLQTIMGLLLPAPKTDLILHKHVIEKNQMEWSAIADYSTYTTLLCEEQTHSRALTAVTKTGRLVLAQAMEPEYSKIAMEHWRPHEILQAQRQQSQAFVVFMLQKLFNTSMQASLVGISANLSVANGNDVGADPLTTMTVLLSCMLGVGSVLTEVLSSTAMSARVLHGVDQKLKAEGVTKFQEHHEYVVARQARWEWTKSIMFALWCLSFLLWCTLKTVMARYCDCGMWNFTMGIFSPSNWGFQESMGCVFFSHDTASVHRCSLSDSYISGHFHIPAVSFTDIRNSTICSFI